MIAIIGDVHGCYFTLKELLEKIKEKYPGIKIYSVGDLVDRGMNSCEVMDLIISEQIEFTAGNHDYMFYYFIKNPNHPISRVWLYNGYETTMASYENRMEKMTPHLERIAQAPLFLNLDDCFISHAGISRYYKSVLPKDILSNLDKLETLMRGELASEHGILWTRDVLIDLNKLQIVGHTRKDDVIFLKTSNALYIDTSAYSGHKLTAVMIEDNKIFDKISVKTHRKDLD
jgi:serine/threonine protein phosphatase 1